MEKEAVAIKSDILRLAWSMRGGLTYDEGMQLSYTERQIINDIIKENFEVTKKSGLPYF